MSKSISTEVDAKNYLDKHNILQLFEKLCAELILKKPEDPRSFIIEQIKLLPTDKKVGLSVFNETDIDAMFLMLDPIQRGFITGVQLNTTLKTLGYNDNANHDENAHVSKLEFKQIISALVKI